MNKLAKTKDEIQRLIMAELHTFADCEKAWGVVVVPVVDDIGGATWTVSVTFQVDRGAVSFQVPIHLDVSDYDDTEMVQAARSVLHQTFAELAAQSQDWKLSRKDLKLLSSMSLRVNK